MTSVKYRSPDLNLLLVFQAIYSERNLTRAAEKFGLSQPAMSNALARLRVDFKDKLFVKTATGFRPTKRADEIAISLKPILNDLDALVSGSSFDPAISKARFRIASVDYFNVAIFPRLIKYLRENAPQIDVQLIPSVGESYEMLDKDEVDFAVASFGVPPKRFGHCVLHVDDYTCVVRKTHPLAGETPTARQYARFDHVLMSPKGDSHGVGDSLLANLGLSRNVSYTVNNFAAAIPLIQQHDLILTAPKKVIREIKTDALVEFPCPLDVPNVYRSLELIWNDKLSNAATEWFRDVLVTTSKKC